VKRPYLSEVRSFFMYLLWWALTVVRADEEIIVFSRLVWIFSPLTYCEFFLWIFLRCSVPESLSFGDVSRQEICAYLQETFGIYLKNFHLISAQCSYACVLYFWHCT